MSIQHKLLQGTAAWFQMAGEVMHSTASQAGLSPDLTVSLLERYTDGVKLFDDLYQGIRLDIASGTFSFRVGVKREEEADVMVFVTSAAARTMNLLRDKQYAIARENFLHTGAMRVEGDPSRLGSWLDAAHDQIVDRTK